MDYSVFSAMHGSQWSTLCRGAKAGSHGLAVQQTIIIPLLRFVTRWLLSLFVQVQQILRSCLCEASRDPTVQLVVFVLGQGRRHPCRGAGAVSHGPFSTEILQLQYIDKVVDVCCAGCCMPVVCNNRCLGR